MVEPNAIATDAIEVQVPPRVADEAVARAERIAFLALASELARGRNVLVVDDGASALAGIAAHLDSLQLDELSSAATATYDLVVAELPSAELDATSAIGQLVRVVSETEGIALIRLPNRPEFDPLLAEISAGFARTLTMRQANWVSSALFDDAMFANDDPSRAVAATVRKLAAAAPGEELYRVVIGAHGAFPEFRPQLALTRSPQLRAALAELAELTERTNHQIDQLQRVNSQQDARIRQLEEELAWYDEKHLALRRNLDGTALLSFWVTLAESYKRLRNRLGG